MRRNDSFRRIRDAVKRVGLCLQKRRGRRLWGVSYLQLVGKLAAVGVKETGEESE